MWVKPYSTLSPPKFHTPRPWAMLLLVLVLVLGSTIMSTPHVPESIRQKPSFQLHVLINNWSIHIYIHLCQGSFIAMMFRCSVATESPLWRHHTRANAATRTRIIAPLATLVIEVAPLFPLAPVVPPFLFLADLAYIWLLQTCPSVDRCNVLHLSCINLHSNSVFMPITSTSHSGCQAWRSHFRWSTLMLGKKNNMLQLIVIHTNT